MKLPEQVTGFRMYNDPARALLIDEDYFKSACYGVAIQLGAEVVECKPQLDVDRNYYYAIFKISEQYKERQVTILCNPYYGYIAFIPTSVWRFVDEPALAEKFLQFDGFQTLALTILDTFPAQEHLTDLNKAELNQIKHWKSQCLGEIIFNQWD